MNKIYYNGSIITMEERTDSGAAPEAVLVRDGKLAAVGSLEECEREAKHEQEVARDCGNGKKSSEYEKVDLQGKCLMPAFIDSHSHVVMNGQMSICAYLGDCESFEDIVRVLREYIAENEITKEDMVIGFGYDHNFLKEQTQPDKRVLDKVSTEIPVMLLHTSAHFMCVNSAALRLAGVDDKTLDPEGGVIDRLPGTKEPSGYMEENAMTPFSKLMGEQIAKRLPEVMQGMQKAYLAHGVTTVQDGASTESELRLLKAMGEGGSLKLDVVSYLMMPQGGCEIMAKEGEAYREYKEHLRIGGYKLVLDGSPQGRSAWLTKPYEGEEEYKGYAWMSEEQVQSYVSQAVREGRQLLVHCNGDAAGDQFLNAYEKALSEAKQGIGDKADRENPIGEKTNAMNLRPVMIHSQTAREDQLERMAKLGMIASIFVGHVWYWGDIHLKNLGKERGSRISPAKTALEKGVTITFHQDTPVTKPDMLHTVWTAVNRLSRNGQSIGPDQRISVYEALKAVTINAAYQYFEEDTKGSLRVGKRADLVILDKSPLEVNPMDIRDIRVLETIKDGETVFSL